MRVSVQPDDPGYVGPGGDKLFEVLVDGVSTRDKTAGLYIVTADEEEGFVVEMRRSLRGAVLRDPETGKPKLFTRRAQVRIIPCAPR